MMIGPGDPAPFHNQAGRHIGQPCFDLATRHFWRGTILPTPMQITVTELLRFWRQGVLLVFGAPCQPQSLTGQEHGRTISRR